MPSGYLKKRAAVDPWLTLAGLDAAHGAYSLFKNRPRESGRSKAEEQSLSRVANPLLNKDQAIAELKEHRKRVSAFEGAGSGLAVGGTAGLGYLGKTLLNRSVLNAEKGQTTTPRDVANLYDAMIRPKEGEIGMSVIKPGMHPEYPEGAFVLEHKDRPTTLLRNDADMMRAHHIPKGGYSRFLGRAAEVDDLRRRGITENEIKSGLEHGMSILPGKAGPHAAAHELGHMAFENTGVGKLTRGLRTPIMVGSTVGSGLLASRGDPDSTSAKLAPLVAAAGLVPTLGEEAYATVKGLKGMRDAGYSRQAISQGAKQLGKAFGSYGMKYGLPAIATPIIIRNIRKARMAKRHESGLETSQDVREAIKGLQET